MKAIHTESDHILGGVGLGVMGGWGCEYYIEIGLLEMHIKVWHFIMSGSVN